MFVVDYSIIHTDFVLENRGSMYMLKPLTLEGKRWCDEFMADRQSWPCCQGRCYNLEAHELPSYIIGIDVAHLTILRFGELQ